MHIVVIQYGNTALHIASEIGHVEIVQLLRQHHADYYIENKVRNVSFVIVVFVVLLFGLFYRCTLHV